MVVVSDFGILDEGLIILSFCVVDPDSTVVVWVLVGDTDVPVASSQ